MLQWQQLGSPSRLHLVELGPGRGTLMADLLRGTLPIRPFSQALSLHMVEVSPSSQLAGCSPSESPRRKNLAHMCQSLKIGLECFLFAFVETDAQISITGYHLVGKVSPLVSPAPVTNVHKDSLLTRNIASNSIGSTLCSGCALLPGKPGHEEDPGEGAGCCRGWSSFRRKDQQALRCRGQRAR